MSPTFISLKSKRNIYLHPLIKFLLPNTLPFGKTWWAHSQNLSPNTKTGFIKSQGKQVCLSCCISKIPSDLLMVFLHQCLIPISSLIYMLYFSLPSRGMGTQDKWLQLTLKKHKLSQHHIHGPLKWHLRAIPVKQVYSTLPYSSCCGQKPCELWLLIIQVESLRKFKTNFCSLMF